MKRVFNLSVGVVLLAVLTIGCEHRELCYDHTHYTDVSVRFDWTHAKDAQPKQMRLLAYTSEGGVDEFDLAGRDGGLIRAHIGRNQLICHNGDLSTLRTMGSHWENYEIYSPSTSLEAMSQMFIGTRAVPRARGTEDERVIFEPDYLWAASDADCRVNGAGQSITMMMSEVVYNYALTIHNVANLEYVSDLTATLSGMSGSYFPSTGKVSDTHCLQNFDMTNDGVSTITGTVRTFGHCPDGQQNEHKLVVYAILRDGSKWYYTFDVTDALHKADQSQDNQPVTGEITIPIELEELPFPEPFGATNSGMTPSMDEWQEINVVINM